MLGSGVGSTGVYLTDRFGMIQVAHNEFLRVLCELGIVGFALGICLLWRIYWGLGRIQVSEQHEFGFLKPLALGVFTSFVVCSLTDNTLEYYAVFTGYVATFVALAKAGSWGTRGKETIRHLKSGEARSLSVS